MRGVGQFAWLESHRQGLSVACDLTALVDVPCLTARWRCLSALSTSAAVHHDVLLIVSDYADHLADLGCLGHTPCIEWLICRCTNRRADVRNESAEQTIAGDCVFLAAALTESSVELLECKT